MIKTLFFRISFALFGSMIISSCGNVDDVIDEPNLNFEKPFGFTWETTDKFVADFQSDCNQLIESMGILLNTSEIDKALSDCESGEYSTSHLPYKEIPTGFDKGEFSVGLLGGTQPVLYSYSYLHDWGHDDLERKQQLRNAHASELNTRLIQLYGPPNTKGHFNQSAQFGFIVDNEVEQPCSFWLIQDIGILLCSERVVMVDGVEMSLSFVNLKEEIVGNQVHNMAMIASGQKSTLNTIRAETQTKSSFSKIELRKLSKLIFPDEVHGCRKSDLQPIGNIWAQQQSNNAKFVQIYENYAGDKLADYVFENAHDLESELPDIEQDLAVMLLLKHAADQGSAAAMNEIGGSLLYCYQGIQQDINAAILWLNKAVAAGDTMAKQTLAHLHLANLMGVENPKNEALKLLDQCSKANPEVCAEDFETLKAFMKPAEE